MAPISEDINSSNQKFYSHDKMSKMIVNLCSKKCEDKQIPYANWIIFIICYY